MRVMRARGTGALASIGLVTWLAVPALGQLVASPSVETDAVPTDGDAADDAAVWLHPDDPASSLIIGTDKESGLAVYDLGGTELQFVGGMRPNNVDVRYGFPLGGVPVDIAAFGDRVDQTIKFFAIDPVTRTVSDVTSGTVSIGINEAYGFCLYRSRCDGSYYAFVNDQDGQLEQWRLFDDGQGRIGATSVRLLQVGSQTEGMVADDELGFLYVGEEEVAIWKYAAEPHAGDARVQVDADGGHFTADVEGLAIYHAAGGTGYLIASSQGSSEYAVYRREGDNEHVLNFQIGAAGRIDAVTGTDGIDVTSAPLGPAFPFGAFVAQDDENPPENQNYKLVPWEAIASPPPGAPGATDEPPPPPLVTDTSVDPRFVPVNGDLDGNGLVDVNDLLVFLPQWGPCGGFPAPRCVADLDCDGAIGPGDLLELLASWGG